MVATAMWELFAMRRLAMATGVKPGETSLANRTRPLSAQGEFESNLVISPRKELRPRSGVFVRTTHLPRGFPPPLVRFARAQRVLE